MTLFKKLSIVTSILATTTVVSQATLIDFVDYNLGGTTASWDIFYGGNYLPEFEFLTGTVGNPIIDSTSNLTLRMEVVGYFFGPPPTGNVATGPIGPDNAIPGDRERFYTFFSTEGLWDIGMVASEVVNQVVFQVNQAPGGGVEQIPGGAFLNGVEGTYGFDNTTFVSTWTWNNLNLAQGAEINVTWETGTHSGFDAFQIQTSGSVVPEPTTLLMVGFAGLVFSVSRRRRSN